MDKKTKYIGFIIYVEKLFGNRAFDKTEGSEEATTQKKKSVKAAMPIFWQILSSLSARQRLKRQIQRQGQRQRKQQRKAKDQDQDQDQDRDQDQDQDQNQDKDRDQDQTKTKTKTKTKKLRTTWWTDNQLLNLCRINDVFVRSTTFI
jgi:hypothetical protein